MVDLYRGIKLKEKTRKPNDFIVYCLRMFMYGVLLGGAYLLFRFLSGYI
jgi:hypothetical protein